MLDGMGDEAETPIAPPMSRSLLGGRGPISGNAGIGGGLPRGIEAPLTPMPGIADPPMPERGQPAPMRKLQPAPIRKPGNIAPESEFRQSEQGPVVGLPRGEETQQEFGSDGWMKTIMEVANEMKGRMPGMEQATQAVPAGAATSAPASALAARYPSIVKAYQQSLGRVPSDDEILSQSGNGSFRENDPRLVESVQNIVGSEEAGRYSPEREGPVGRIPERDWAEQVRANNPGIEEPAPSALAARYPGIVEAYREYLGRTPSDDEILGQVGNGTFSQNDRRLGLSIENIRTSDEASRYAPPDEEEAAPEDAEDTYGSYERTKQNMPAGVDSAKWLSGHVSPKYAWKEVASQHSLKTTAGRDAALTQLKTQYPQYFANATWEGDKLRIGGELHPDFKGLSLIDVIKDEEGAAQPRWGDPTQDAKNAQQRQGSGVGLAPGREPMQNSLIEQIRAAIMSLM